MEDPCFAVPSMPQGMLQDSKEWANLHSNKSHPAEFEIPPGILDRHYEYIPREKQAYSAHCIPDCFKCAHCVPLQADFASTMMLFLQERKYSGVRVRLPRGMTLAPKRRITSPVTPTVEQRRRDALAGSSPQRRSKKATWIPRW
jgi:hypothetical protein